jgi:hypothetical protein
MPTTAAHEAGEGLEGVIVRCTTQRAQPGWPAPPRTRTASTSSATCPTLPIKCGGRSGGYANTTDPDSGTANESTVVLGAGATNLTQDFGYRGAAAGTIGNLVWNDLNANGLVDGGESDLTATIDPYQDHNGNGNWTSTIR